ncbi:hypothetical protein CesoFtcFv8_015498 [Champsocephalus esox]|nr:hypothetical protein CesoFtcFv8_015498 [Champsocephalus esox]
MRSGLLLFMFTQVILVASLTQTDKCGGDYRDPHPGLPDLPRISRRVPALPAVRVGDLSPGARAEDPHQLQSAF